MDGQVGRVEEERGGEGEVLAMDGQVGYKETVLLIDCATIRLCYY
jgi:hypothetical protein